MSATALAVLLIMGATGVLVLAGTLLACRWYRTGMRSVLDEHAAHTRATLDEHARRTAAIFDKYRKGLT